MGLFKSDDTLHPEPTVTLQLDPNCRTPFSPGSKVMGHVYFDSNIQREIDNIEVIVEGTTTTKYVLVVSRGEYRRVKIHYFDEATLRTIKEVVVRGLTAEAGPRYSWNFCLTFPNGRAALLHPNPAKSPYKSTSGHREFYASSPYQLPPSFMHMKSHEHMAQVQYTLRVQVNFADQKKPYGPPPKILTYVPSAEPYEQKLVENASGLAKFKEKVSSSSPSVKLSLKTTLPTSVVRGAAFPIHARLEIHPLSDPSVLNIPEVQIKIASIELAPLVIYRTLKDPKAMDMPLDNLQAPAEQELVEEGKAVVLNAVPQEIMVAQQREGKSDVLVYSADFEARLPGDVTPSFATTNVILWWKLRVKLVVDVCGKEFDDIAETKILVISDVESGSVLPPYTAS